MPEREDNPEPVAPRTVAPVASVIITCYNTAPYAKAAMESVFAQTFSDYEVIVINDGSPDTTELELVLAPYRARIRYLKQENLGSSAARNTGIRMARGRYLALLDSDDLWEPEYLRVSVAKLEAEPEIDLIYGDALIIGDPLYAGKRYMELCPSEGEVTLASLVRQECNVLSAVTVRREAILRAGLFDESLTSSVDFDLWLRLLLQGGRISYHRQVLSRYRKREGSLSSVPIRIWGSLLQTLEKAQRTMRLSPEDERVIAEQCTRCRAILHLYYGKEAFLQADPQMAIDHLRAANDFLRSPKLALVIAILGVSPRLLLSIYRLRDRYLISRVREAVS